jgi:hypothetical protein
MGLKCAPRRVRRGDLGGREEGRKPRAFQQNRTAIAVGTNPQDIAPTKARKASVSMRQIVKGADVKDAETESWLC